MESEKNEKDQVEIALSELIGDDQALLGVLNLVKIFKDSGNIEVLEKILTENMPGNTKAYTSLLDKRELHLGSISMMNSLLAVMASVSGKTSQSALNLLLYNSEDVLLSMIEGAKQPENFSILRLMGMLKDPEIAAGLSAVLNALKTLGSLLKKVDTE
ncbi:MAG: DUF1641 domain-containing protein [Candidatus Thermoplasmatota archaeon]|nr:DUF1641 domain-containing protein [Candidatus Thermoplasmatota archaeon]